MKSYVIIINLRNDAKYPSNIYEAHWGHHHIPFSIRVMGRLELSFQQEQINQFDFIMWSEAHVTVTATNVKCDTIEHCKGSPPPHTENTAPVAP